MSKKLDDFAIISQLAKQAGEEMVARTERLIAARNAQSEKELRHPGVCPECKCITYAECILEECFCCRGAG